MNESPESPRTCTRCGGNLSDYAGVPACPNCLFGEALVKPGNGEPEVTPEARHGFRRGRELGRGSSGVVYEASRDNSPGKWAIKVLNAGWAHDAEARLRFRREVAALSRLDHPNILRPVAWGLEDTPPWYAMPFVEGGSLASQLRQRAPSLDEIQRWMQELTAAMEHAHGAGLLHRDLKPANVLIGKDGEAFLTDFGLAKFLSPPTQASLEMELTLNGGLLGSANYMAPEQARGDEAAIGKPTDVYGLGAVLYHCLTARPPFSHGSLSGILQQVEVADPLPPRRLNGQIPIPLESICLKCLEKDPKRRYASVTALREDLQRFGRGEPTRARPMALPARLWRIAGRHPAVAGLLVTLAVVMVLGTAFSRWQLHRTRAANEDLARMQERQSVELGVSLMSQGRKRTGIARVARALRNNPENRAAAAVLWAVLMDQPWSVPVFVLPKDPDFALIVRASWDGAYLATVGAGRPGARRICIWQVSQPTLIRTWETPGTDISEVGFSRDSSMLRLVTHNPTETNFWTIDGQPVPSGVGGTGFEITDAERNSLTNSFPMEELTPAGGFGPREGSGLFVTLSGSQIRWRDQATGDALGDPVEFPGVIEEIGYAAQGQWVAVSAVATPVSGWKLTLPERSVVGWSHPGRPIHFSLDPQGREVRQGSSQGIYRRPVDSPGYRKAEIQPEEGFAVASLDSGVAEAIASLSGRVRIIRGRGSPPIEVSPPAPKGIDFLVASPDSRWIAAATTNHAVCVWDARTGASIGRPVRLVEGEASAWGIQRACHLEFSPDSRLLAATSPAGVAALIDVPSLEVRQRHPMVGPCRSPRFSSDGTWWAFGSGEHLVKAISLKAGISDAVTLRQPGIPVSVGFAHRGHQVVSSTHAGMVRVWSLPNGNLRHELFTDGNHVRWAGFSPDDQVIAAITVGGRVFRWDAEWGIPLGTPTQLKGELITGQYSPDGRHLVVAAGEGGGWILPHHPAPVRPPPWLAELAEAVVGERILEDGSTQLVGVEDFLDLRRRLAAWPADGPEGELVRRFGLFPSGGQNTSK